MNSGASERDVAALYLRNTASGSGAGGNTTIHQHGDVNVSALDTGGFESYLRSGGMDSIAKVENERAARYSGDSY
jgi:hypothetical protein